MRRASWPLIGFLGVLVGAAGAATVGAQRGATTEGEWRYYSGDIGATKYSPLAQITKENVKNLRIAWRRPAVSPDLTASIDGFRIIPTSARRRSWFDGVLYASNGIGLVEAFDPETGKTLWVQQPSTLTAPSLQGTSQPRGRLLGRRRSERRLFAIRGAYLFALDPRNGEPDHRRSATAAGWT